MEALITGESARCDSQRRSRVFSREFDPDSPGNIEAGEHSWFAVQTKARHEKRVAAELEEKGVVAFLPLYSEVHQWSDRKRQVELPLFSTYVFVRIDGEQSSRIKVLQTNSVFRFVGVRGMGSPIPDEQIETLQTIIREKVPFFSAPVSQRWPKGPSPRGQPGRYLWSALGNQ